MLYKDNKSKTYLELLTSSANENKGWEGVCNKNHCQSNKSAGNAAQIFFNRVVILSDPVVYRLDI